MLIWLILSSKLWKAPTSRQPQYKHKQIPVGISRGVISSDSPRLYNTAIFTIVQEIIKKHLLTTLAKSFLILLREISSCLGRLLICREEMAIASTTCWCLLVSTRTLSYSLASPLADSLMYEGVVYNWQTKRKKKGRTKKQTVRQIKSQHSAFPRRVIHTGRPTCLSFPQLFTFSKDLIRSLLIIAIKSVRLSPPRCSCMFLRWPMYPSCQSQVHALPQQLPRAFCCFHHLTPNP